MESHGQAHKCIIVKSGEKKLTTLVQGELFEVNSPTTPLSSNYYLSAHPCRTEREESWEASACILFILPVQHAVCSSSEM